VMGKLSGVGVRLATPLTRVPNCQCGTQSIHMPWDKVPFKLLPKSPRAPSIEDTFHASVVERWKSDSKYRPKALSFLTPENIERVIVQP
jgi:hypothetical protein